MNNNNANGNGTQKISFLILKEDYDEFLRELRSFEDEDFELLAREIEEKRHALKAGTYTEAFDERLKEDRPLEPFEDLLYIKEQWVYAYSVRGAFASEKVLAYAEEHSEEAVWDGINRAAHRKINNAFSPRSP